jgi:hypothetical protein
MALPILVVFDIDETLIQFMNGSAHHFLDEISVEDRKTIQDSEIEYLDKKTRNNSNTAFVSDCILFRPHLRKFLDMVKKNPRIHIALWTYAEQEYAQAIGEIITKHFGFKKNPFVFTFGAENMEQEDYPKSLTEIWDKKDFNKYNKFNTIIVDDRLGNVSHENNLYNGIVCQGFAPFHETKSRLPLTKESLAASINDTMFLDLMKIIENSFTFIDGCSKKECSNAFAAESIFSPKIIKKNGNINYVKDVKKIKVKDGVETEKTYTMVAIGDVTLAGSEHKGGSIRKHRKTNSRKTHKNKVHKKRYTKKN